MAKLGALWKTCYAEAKDIRRVDDIFLLDSGAANTADFSDTVLEQACVDFANPEIDGVLKRAGFTTPLVEKHGVHRLTEGETDNQVDEGLLKLVEFSGEGPEVTPRTLHFRFDFNAEKITIARIHLSLASGDSGAELVTPDPVVYTDWTDLLYCQETDQDAAADDGEITFNVPSNKKEHAQLGYVSCTVSGSFNDTSKVSIYSWTPSGVPSLIRQVACMLTTAAFLSGAIATHTTRKPEKAEALEERARSFLEAIASGQLDAGLARADSGVPFQVDSDPESRHEDSAVVGSEEAWAWPAEARE